jgi:hypothetical protein
MLGEGGSLELGALVEQRCDARGAWLSTERIASGAEDAIAASLSEQGRRVGRALHEAGYFGPFGIDAYTYRDELGDLHLQPLSEINARYSMGFATGYGRGGATKGL